MKKSVKTIMMIVAAALVIALAVGLYYLPSALGVSTWADETSADETASGVVAVSTAAVTASLPESSTLVTFSDSKASVSGSAGGVTVEGTAVSITASGVYTITGSCSEGSITVKKGVTDVTLILEDLDLACSTTSPISLNKSTSTVIFVTGTVTLTDNEDEANDTGASNSTFEGAVIKVKTGSSAVICGDGTLNAVGNCKNGIKGAASADITVGGSLTLNITAVNNGLASDNSVTVAGGTINVTSGNDGIKSKPDDNDSTSTGIVTITGGTISINASGDGIQAATDIVITGGDITIVSADDAVHATDITVTAGAVTISCADDAFHADNTLTLGVEGSESGPSVIITESHEGLEAVTISLRSGYGAIVADDDGLNASGGTASSGFGEGQSSSSSIVITGGTWYVNSSGDGIDSNGSITISGGSTVVYGATDNGNAAFDYDGTATLTGGEVLAIGMSGMAQAPDGTVLSFTVNLSAGDTLGIKDASGNEVISSGAVKTANSVIYAFSGLTEGATYTLYVNGTAAATAEAGTYSGFSMGGFGGMGGGPGGQSGFGGGPGGGRGGNR